MDHHNQTYSHQNRDFRVHTMFFHHIDAIFNALNEFNNAQINSVELDLRSSSENELSDLIGNGFSVA
jgi:hypothetical protein